MVQQDPEAGAPTEILGDRTTRGLPWSAVDDLRTPGRRSRKRGHQATDEWSAEENLEVKGVKPRADCTQHKNWVRFLRPPHSRRIRRTSPGRREEKQIPRCSNEREIYSIILSGVCKKCACSVCGGHSRSCRRQEYVYVCEATISCTSQLYIALHSAKGCNAQHVL